MNVTPIIPTVPADEIIAKPHAQADVCRSAAVGARCVPAQTVVRFAAITDIHHYPTGRLAPEIAFWKLTAHAHTNAVDFNNILGSDRYHFGINLGDIVEDSGADPNGARIDENNYGEVIGALDTKKPLYYAIGNHDTVNLSTNTISRMTGCEPFYAFDEGPFHFVVLHSVADASDATNTQIPPEQLQWLAEDLSANTGRPTVVFLHHALSERSVEGNHWFEPNPRQAFVKNRQAVRDLFKASGNVCLVMNGHLHDNNLYVDPDDDTAHVTLQSSTENIGAHTSSNAWADVTLTTEGARIAVHGHDSVTHLVSFPERIRVLFANESTMARSDLRASA